MFEIDKNIPIPDSPGSRRQIAYPLAKMKIGDSFFVPAATRSPALVRSALRVDAKSIGITIVTRTMENGLRVWRINPNEIREYPIEKNIPIPDREKFQRYPFSKMEVGDSFFVPGPVDRKRVNSIMNSARGKTYSTRIGKKFIYRTVNGGVRIWRIK